MTKKKLFDLWENEQKEEYPQNLAERGVPQNMLFDFVSNQFLDGFINYVKPVFCCVVETYKKLENIVLEVERFNQSFHSSFDILSDNVWILAESENSFWFFAYDKDASDCVIGRIEKIYSKEEMIEFFINQIGEIKFLPIKLSGWISSR